VSDTLNFTLCIRTILHCGAAITSLATKRQASRNLLANKMLIYYLHNTVMYCEGFFIVNKSKKMPPIKRSYSKESQEDTQVK
ncbi:MAG: hypothetical protein ACI33K_04840, partial [Clostridiaceae bacterium]